jgi:autotransporter-associated beta strand protein
VGSDLSLGDISEQTAGSGIIMAGWRTLFLTGTNTYSGNTVVSSGTLALTGSASISNTPNITIASNAKLDVSGLTTTFSLGSGQTLTGSGATGTINSNVNMNLGSLALNYTNGTPTLTVTNGTLTFNNNATAVTVLGATPLAVGSYRLVSAGTGGAVAGSVNTAPTVNGAGVVAGHAVSLSIVSGELYLVVTNRNPLANPSTYSRPAGFSLKIPIIGNLATNWSDPDGDTVTLTSSISSTNGATVSYDNNYVYYSNPHNVTDQIAYTVGDVWGGTAPGMINIGIVASAGGVAQNISTVGGVVTVKFSGIPNFRYDIERATDVNFTANLTVLITTNAPANGQFQFTDNSPPQPAAFYRLKYNP